MKKLSGFSLMEMMIVLLIVSIVAAASAPMINKKLVGVASDKSPWVWVGQDRDIAYNLLGQDSQTATIGRTAAPNDAGNPRLYVHTTDATPQIALGHENSSPFKIMGGGTSIMMTDNVDDFDSTFYQTAIGYSANASGNTATAIGYNTSAANNAVALGYNANSGVEDIAIGHNATASRPDAQAADGGASVAIGKNSTAGAADCIAIGHRANATLGSSIAIGTAAHFAGLSGTRETQASGGGSIAIGDGPHATAQHSMAIGKGGNATGNNSLALGYLAQSLGINSVAIGSNSTAQTSNGEGWANTTAVGVNSSAAGWNATAIGERARAGYGATALGSNTISTGPHTVTLGFEAKTGNSLSAEASGAIAIGARANALARDSAAFGVNSTASAQNTIAIGYGANATHKDSVAIGQGATTDASNQIVLGRSGDTVYIPGNLIVEGTVLLSMANKTGTGAAGAVYLREAGGNLDIVKFKKADSNTGIFSSTGSGSIEIMGRKYTYWKSDRRLKNIKSTFNFGLNEIKKLEVFNYTFKSDKSKTPRVGVMAQDLQKIFPDAVVKGEDGFLRIRMEDMFYALVNAVKELDAKIEALKNQEISVLKDKVAKLEKENKEIKKQNEEVLKRLADLEKKIK